MMGWLLIAAGVGMMCAWQFGTPDVRAKNWKGLHIGLAGFLLLCVGAAMNTPRVDCESGWGPTGSYDDC